VGALLLAAAALLFPLAALTSPDPPPHSLSPLQLLRVAVGLPVVLFLPAWFLAPRVFGDDLRLGGAAPATLDLRWTALASAALNVFVHALNFNLLRLAGLPIRGPALLLLALLESAVAWALFSRRTGAGPAPASTPAATRRGLLVSLLALALFSAWKAPHLLRDGSWYFWSDALAEGWEAPPDPGALSATWLDGRPLEPGEPFVRDRRILSLTIENSAEISQEVPVFVLVPGPVGTVLRLAAPERPPVEDAISTFVQLPGDERPAERYWLWGAASTLGWLTVPARGSAALEVQVLPPPGAAESLGAGAESRILAWMGLPGGSVVEDLAERGIHFAQPYQILNVTENIRWADEVASTRVLPGRSPDDLSTLHQPPAWTYLYAPARELLARQGVAASALFLAILLGLVLAGLLGIEADSGPVPPLLAATLLFAALQVGRLMVVDGSMNFPDPLYALALLASVVALFAQRPRVFVAWGLLASLSRYPGAVVLLMAGACLLALDPQRSRRAALALVRLALLLALFCGAMLVAGLLSERLEAWFFALYFETVPEHFGHEGAPPLLERAWDFLRVWGLSGGLAALPALLPPRGMLARVALGTALLYAPFLMFIDHVSHHYFLPLLALGATAAAASMARLAEPWRTRLGLALALGSGLLLLLAEDWGV
jgi:hypothetical protein